MSRLVERAWPRISLGGARRGYRENRGITVNGGCYPLAPIYSQLAERKDVVGRKRAKTGLPTQASAPYE